MNPSTFTILVHGCAENCESHQSAHRFTEAAVALGHSVDAIFFYGDATSISIQSEHQQTSLSSIQQSWLQLSKQFNIPLQACISTSIKRGVIDPQQAVDTHQSVNLVDGFSLEGLGALAEKIHQQSRLIEFGA